VIVNEHVDRSIAIAPERYARPRLIPPDARVCFSQLASKVPQKFQPDAPDGAEGWPDWLDRPPTADLDNLRIATNVR